MKKIRIKVRNKELDGLEDMLYCELTDLQEVLAKKRVRKLWRRMVKEYDKENKR